MKYLKTLSGLLPLLLYFTIFTITANLVLGEKNLGVNIDYRVSLRPMLTLTGKETQCRLKMSVLNLVLIKKLPNC